MEQLRSQLEDWCSEIATYHIPRWDELPDFDLYMDQVITYIEKCLRLPLGNGTEKIITPAMINNYVKQKLMPAPVKKKYAKRHLAYLVAISFLKQVITISEIKDGIDCSFALHGSKKAYDLFCNQQEHSLRLVISHTSHRQEVSWENEEQLVQLALKMATLAFSSKVLAEMAIKVQKVTLALEQKTIEG